MLRILPHHHRQDRERIANGSLGIWTSQVSFGVARAAITGSVLGSSTRMAYTVRLPVPGSPSPSFPCRRKTAIFALPTLTDRFEEQRVPKDSPDRHRQPYRKDLRTGYRDGTTTDLASDQGQ
jgi:hypothetical protein